MWLRGQSQWSIVLQVRQYNLPYGITICVERLTLILSLACICVLSFEDDSRVVRDLLIVTLYIFFVTEPGIWALTYFFIENGKL